MAFFDSLADAEAHVQAEQAHVQAAIHGDKLGEVIFNALALALPEAVVKAATRTLWSKQWLTNLQLLRLLY